MHFDQQKQNARCVFEFRETESAVYATLWQAIGTGDPTIAEQNIKFFIDAGLLEDKDQHIALALGQNQAGAAILRWRSTAGAIRSARNRQTLQLSNAA